MGEVTREGGCDEEEEERGDRSGADHSNGGEAGRRSVPDRRGVWRLLFAAVMALAPQAHARGGHEGGSTGERKTTSCLHLLVFSDVRYPWDSGLVA